GLSPLLVRELFALLRKLNADGLALLLVEQNTTMALAVAARAYVMELGRVVMHGRPSELAADSRLRAAYLGGKWPPRGAAEARHPCAPPRPSIAPQEKRRPRWEASHCSSPSRPHSRSSRPVRRPKASGCSGTSPPRPGRSSACRARTRSQRGWPWTSST